MSTVFPTDSDLNTPPNLSWLGSGFDVFGTLNDASLKYRMVNLGTPTQKIELFDREYVIPASVEADTSGQHSSECTAYETTVACQQSLMAEVQQGAHGTIRGIALEGEMNARFGLTLQEDESRFVATYNSYQRYYKLWIATPPSMSMLPTDIQQLPTTYDPTTRAKFFNVFNEYGVSCVRSIECGGRLRLDVTTTDASVNTTADMHAAAKASGDALFAAGGKSQASTDWSRVSSRWVKGSNLTWTADGGNPKTLIMAPGTIDPKQTPFIDAHALTDWSDSIPTHPTVVSFELISLADIVSNAGGSPALVSALDAATADYTGTTLVLSGSSGQGTAKWGDGAKADVRQNLMFIIIDRQNPMSYQTYLAGQLTEQVVKDAQAPGKFCVFITGNSFLGNLSLVYDLLEKTSGAADLRGYKQLLDGGQGSPFDHHSYVAITWMDKGQRVGQDLCGSINGMTLAVPLWQEADGIWYGPDQWHHRP